MKKLLIFALLFVNSFLVNSNNNNNNNNDTTNNHNNYKDDLISVDFGCIDKINKTNIKYIDYDAFDYEHISEKLNKKVTSTNIIVSKDLYQEVINDYKTYKTSNFDIKRRINKKYGLKETNNINTYEIIKI